jgi:hypothetical protein
MARPWGRRWWLRIALALLAGLPLAGCASTGSSPGASATESPGAHPTPTATPSSSAEPVSRWDAPGSSTLAQARAVARRYAVAVHAETIKGARLYTQAATWDYWPNKLHYQGAATIEEAYIGNAGVDWSKRVHILAAPGVAVDEGMITAITQSSAGACASPFVVLLAVDGDRVIHEEVFHDMRDVPVKERAPVEFWGSPPGPRDTAPEAAEAGAAAMDAFAGGDEAALRKLVAADVLFFDTGQTRGRHGVAALLDWWSRVPAVELVHQAPIAGPGWAVVRWTIRAAAPWTGKRMTMPGATVMEVRRGTVVRMTFYYDSKVFSLQQ